MSIPDIPSDGLAEGLSPFECGYLTAASADDLARPQSALPETAPLRTLLRPGQRTRFLVQTDHGAITQIDEY